MVTRHAILVLAMALPGAVGGQMLDHLWYRTQGGPNTDEAWAVATDSAGNAYWASHQTVPGPLADIHLVKLAPDGVPIWTGVWAKPQNQQAYIVAVREPFVFVGGALWNGLWLNSVDMALACFSTVDGSLAWEFTWDQGFGYEEIDGLVVDEESIYVAGWTTGQATGNDLAVLRLTLDGHIVWTTTWGTPQWDEANGQIALIDGIVYVAGRYGAPSELAGGDAVLAAFDAATGQYLWHRTWGGTAVDDALGLAGSDTTIAVVGLTTSFGGSRIFLLTYDRAGNLLWDRTWGGTGSEAARAVGFLPGGDILVGGKTAAWGAGQFDMLLLRYAPDGGTRWHREWGGAAADEIHGMAVADSFVYLAGETWSWGAGKNDAVVVKATTMGEFPAETRDAPPAGPLHLAVSCSPNPCRTSTTVRIDLPAAGPVNLRIIDVAGRTLSDRTVCCDEPGPCTLTLALPETSPGVYVCRLAHAQGAGSAPLVVLR